jgi:hypothetical protein
VIFKNEAYAKDTGGFLFEFTRIYLIDIKKINIHRYVHPLNLSCISLEIGIAFIIGSECMLVAK